MPDDAPLDDLPPWYNPPRARGREPAPDAHQPVVPAATPAARATTPPSPWLAHEQQPRRRTVARSRTRRALTYLVVALLMALACIAAITVMQLRGIGTMPAGAVEQATPAAGVH